MKRPGGSRNKRLSGQSGPFIGETTKMRKLTRQITLGLAAATALTVDALAPTAASAHCGHHHHCWHGGYGLGDGVGPVYVGGPVYDDCLRRQRIMTRHGYRWRTVNVCY